MGVIDIASICHDPWWFPSQRGEVLKRCWGQGKSTRDVSIVGVRHMLWGPHLIGASLILVELRLIHEAVTEFLRVLLLKQSWYCLGYPPNCIADTERKFSFFPCWRDWFELWVKKILSAKLPNRPKICSHHPCHESLRFKQLWNYRAMATGNTAAVTLSEYHEFINHKVCHNVIVPDLGMCSCQQDCQDCTLTPHGNSFYLLYN